MASYLLIQWSFLPERNDPISEKQSASDHKEFSLTRLA